MPNTKRPHVICHMMSTIEGKITSGTGVDILEDYFELYTKVEDRLQAKAWLLGRVTMQMFADDSNILLPPLRANIDNTDFKAPSQGDFYMFAVDTRGVLRWKENIITLSNVADKLNLVVVVSNQTPKDYLAHLQEKAISYLFAGEDQVNFNILLEKMKVQFGVEKLLLEGGGTLNGSVMAEDLVDEISLLLTPLVINRSIAPSVFERRVDEKLDIKKYSLTSVEKMEDDAVWLRYERNK